MQTKAHPTASRRAPSLHEEAQARATEAFNRRMAELAALAPLLAQLQELRPALEERGCTLYTDTITLERESLSGGYSMPRHKVLRLQTSGWCDKSKPRRFLTALQDLGLKVVSTRPAPYGSALLRKGALLLRVDLADPDVAPILTAAPAATAHAAEQVPA